MHKVLASACVVAIAGVLGLLVLVLEANSCKHRRTHKATSALRELANTKVCRRVLQYDMNMLLGKISPLSL